MNPLIRLIALDLDGTIFTDKKVITARTQNAILAAIRQGIIVVPATGRPVAGIPEEFTKIPGVRYAISCNGAVITDLPENKVIYQSCIPPDAVLKVIHLLKDFPGTLELYMNGTACISKENMEHLEEYVLSPPLRTYIKNTRIVVDDLEEFFHTCPNGIEKINMSYGTAKRKEEARKKLEPLLDQLDCVNGQPTNLELTKKGTDKGEALLALGRLMGIEREQIMAFGDSSNDRGMILKAGVGIVMANGDPLLQAEGDFVTQYTNNEDGAAAVIEELLKSGFMEFTLEGKDMICEDAVYSQIQSLGFPEIKEKNLDGLAEMLSQIDQPVEITLCSYEILEENLGDYARQLLDVFTEITRRNENIIFNIEETIFHNAGGA